MVKRSGLSLVELIVALFILEIAFLGVVGSSLYALQLLQRAQAREAALLKVSFVADSLLAGDSISAGSLTRGNVDLSWNIEQQELRLRAMYHAAGRSDTLEFRLPAWPARPIVRP